MCSSDLPILGERVDRFRWAAVVVGFGGALIIVRPGAADAATWAAPLLLGSAICTGFYQLCTRILAGQDRAETTSLWAGMVSGLTITAVIPFFWSMPHGWLVWTLALVIGAIGGSGHFLLAKAFERAPASVLSPFNYLQLPGATLTGFAIYGVLPDATTWVGAAIIVAAGLTIAYREKIAK